MYNLSAYMVRVFDRCQKFANHHLHVVVADELFVYIYVI